MRKNLFIIILAITVIFNTAAAMGADEAELLTIAPRWGTMWLSPDISANWVNMEVHNPLPKDSKAKGNLILEVPNGVECIWSSNKKIEHKPNADGTRTLLTIPYVDLTTKRPGHKGEMYYFITTLPAGTEETAKVWIERDGKKTKAEQFPIKVIAVSRGKQPKTLRTGVTMWPYQVHNWPNFIDEFASLGFNHNYFWSGVLYDTNYKLPENLDSDERLKILAKDSWKKNITTSVVGTGTWDFETIDKNPNAQALFAKGTRRGPCPSYRGPGFSDAVKQNCEKVAKSGVSYILSDEEFYMTHGFTIGKHICFCPRCEALWKKWLPEHRPDLSYISPREVIERKEELPQHLHAWWTFRASLTTDRYRIWRDEFFKAVEKYGAKSSPSPMFGWCVGAADVTELNLAMIDSRSIGDVLDVHMPQIYYRYRIPPRDFRAIVRRQCWAMGRRNTEIIIDTDDWKKKGYANVPDVLLMGVLETAFAGAQGYCMWYGPYMDTRQWAELARANHVLATYERVFLEGRETDLFRSFAPIPQEGKHREFFEAWSNDVCTSTWENDDTGLLLVTDYRQDREPIWVERSRQYTGPMTLYDAFTGEKVAHLTDRQWEFYLQSVKSPVRLLYWNKKNTKSDS
jgi:hypothetical protein